MKVVYRWMILISLAVAVLLASGCVGIPLTNNTSTNNTSYILPGNITPNATPTMNQTLNVTNSTVVIGLTSQNNAFNRSTITVPGCAKVLVIYQNKDSGIANNFAIYNSSDQKMKIYQGKVITGPNTTDYYFNAPCKPGKYYFRSDVHPGFMNGQFVVTAPINKTSKGYGRRLQTLPDCF